ncbi:MAG: hypothetical protein ACPHRO_00505, partial [Nannocystaceae bacterium]
LDLPRHLAPVSPPVSRIARRALDRARLVVHARDPMDADLHREILALFETPQARADGYVTMGQIVDRLVVLGHEEAEVEQEVWSLIRSRRLTPNGYVRRLMKRQVSDGAIHRRAYEFTLIAWDPALDQQLDLQSGDSVES